MSQASTVIAQVGDRLLIEGDTDIWEMIGHGEIFPADEFTHMSTLEAEAFLTMIDSKNLARTTATPHQILRAVSAASAGSTGA